MNNAALRGEFARLSTALLCDACLRSGAPFEIPPPGIRPALPSSRIAGRVLPARHYGSVDIFLEAIQQARAGDILVIDNAGRLDEGCIGDLTALEAAGAGLGGIIVWGAHRDAAELEAIGLPIFSYGACPCGPRRLDPRPADALLQAPFGAVQADPTRFAAADADGVIFAALADAERIFAAARALQATERRQAELLRSGTSLRAQLRFDDYLEARRRDPSTTFRAHLKRVGGAVEE